MALLASCALLSCQRARSESGCALEAGQVLARRPGLAFDAVRVARAGEGRLLAAWSDETGVWLRSLDISGKPLDEERRVTERCAGGIDLHVQERAGAGPKGDARARTLLACSRPGEPGAASLIELDRAGRMTRVHALGPVGRDGRGIALAVHGTRVEAVFHEGSFGQHVIHLAQVDEDARVETRVVSDAARVARTPTLLRHAGTRHVAWVENALSAQGEGPSEIWVQRGDEAPRKVTQSSVSDPAPHLSSDGEDLVLSFRHRKATDKRDELYVARLDASLRPQHAPRRVGRANSEGAPELHACSDLRAAVLPREYGGEHYVAVHPLDAEHHNLGGGHQYYANSREFVLASAACGAGSLSLVIAERAPPSHPGVEVLALRYACR